ncbi:MAG: LPS export ABC transporter periplasmic protein LptC [Bacteroidia bacterium]|nr:LPS export ABC transporter periplasmic protein LptC [Bacteroidia bacterium]
MIILSLLCRTFAIRLPLFYPLLLVLLLSVVACHDNTKDISQMKPYKGPILTAFDTHTLYSDSGRVKIQVYAPIQLEYADGNQDFPKGVTVDFYNKDGISYTRLTSNKARYLRNKNQYIATGDVVVKNLVKNERLNTEELNWTPNDRKIFTDKFVTITTPDEILRGNGLTANQDFTSYRITQPTGKFKIKKP